MHHELYLDKVIQLFCLPDRTINNKPLLATDLDMIQFYHLFHYNLSIQMVFKTFLAHIELVMSL